MIPCISGSGRAKSGCLHVVAIDQILIAKIEFAIADDRMGPDGTARTTDFGLRLKGETPPLLPASRRGLGEHYLSAALFNAVQHATSASDRALPEGARIPDFVTGQEILAQLGSGEITVQEATKLLSQIKGDKK